MDGEQDQGVQVPLLEPIKLGSRETDLTPGIGLDRRAVLRPDERVLFEARSFPTVATLDADGQIVDTFVDKDGGVSTFTDRRLIFVRGNLGVGDDGAVTVVAGHVRWATVMALSYSHRWMFGSRDVFYFETRSASSALLISARAKRAPNDLCPRVVESISIARRKEIPAPAARRDGSLNWVF
jgi:hypothetical protein